MIANSFLTQLTEPGEMPWSLVGYLLDDDERVFVEPSPTQVLYFIACLFGVAKVANVVPMATVKRKFGRGPPISIALMALKDVLSR